jgi:amino acid transporter
MTGYYLAIPHAGFATCIVAVAAYFLTMFLLLFGRRTAWHLNRNVAIIGICIPLLIPILSPAALVVALYIFGTTNSPVFQGRISPTTSYKITIDRSLIGNGSSYNYAVYHNPRWLPFVQKKVENGPTLSCDVPSEMVEIGPGKAANTVTLLCNTHGNQQPPQEIALH